MLGRKQIRDDRHTPEQNHTVNDVPKNAMHPAHEQTNNAPVPNPYRSKKSAKRDARTDDMENRLKNARKERQLRCEERREREERRQEREQYRATHPGFFDPNLRIHGFFSVMLGILAVFVTLSFLLRDLSGAVGAAIADGLLGCFSWAAYSLPLFMLVHAVSWRRDIRERTLIKKALAFLPALLVTSIFACLLSPNFNPNAAFDGVLAYQNGSLSLAGGGAVGELLGNFLYRTIGIIGISLIAIAVYGFFLALHFRTPVKIGYTILRARIKEALVERAKRRAAEEDAAKAAKKESSTPQPAVQDAAPTEALSSQEGVKKTLTGADIAAALSAAGIEPDTDATLPKHKAREEKSVARKRAFFADFEDTMEIERDALPATSRSKQLFDFESQSEDVPESAPLLPPAGGRAASRSLSPAMSGTGASFGENKLSVTRERVRPVRVTEQPTPEPAQDMDYFRKITVSADRREEQTVEPWQKAATAPSFTRTPTPAPAPVTRPAPDVELDDEQDDDTDMFDISVPTRSESAFTATSSLRADLAEAERRGLREEAPAPARTSVSPSPAYTAPASVTRPMPTRAAEAPAPKPKKKPYRFPPLSLLHAPEIVDEGNINAEVQSNAQKLVEVLENFKVHTRVTGYSRGPRITRYEIVPEAGIRVRAISALVDDISMALASAGVRIEAPIPGKAAVGVEVPNANPTIVRLRAMLDAEKFRKFTESTMVCLGADVTGQPVYCDLAKMPHMLVAGATGMGKSVCVNSILTSILYKASPDDVKLILIDPKKVEFSVYRGIPHLLVPVVTDPKKAAGALSWAVSEMERRFELIEHAGVANIKDYNRYVGETGEGEMMPRIVIVIDELADLMLSVGDAVETSIARITAKARAAGIHLLLGTQRPSVDVITGTIKNNIPTRIAFHVPSQADSRTILDFAGAEKLLALGDMLYAPAGSSKPLRVQGAFVDVKEEIARVVEFLKTNNDIDAEAGERIMADIEREAEKCTQKKSGGDEDMPSGGGTNIPTDDDDNHLQWAALEVGFEFGRMSTSLLQRKLSIGYGKAAKILDALEAQGLISPQEGAKPREIRITREEFKEMMAREVEAQCGDLF